MTCPVFTAAEGREKDISWTKFSQPTWSEDRPAFRSHPALIPFLVAAALRWWWTPSLLRKLRRFPWRSVFNRAWARHCVSCYHPPRVPHLLLISGSGAKITPFFFLYLETSPQPANHQPISVRRCLMGEEEVLQISLSGDSRVIQEWVITPTQSSWRWYCWVLCKQDCFWTLQGLVLVVISPMHHCSWTLITFHIQGFLVEGLFILPH